MVRKAKLRRAFGLGWFGFSNHLLDDYKQRAAVLKELDLQRVWAMNLISDVTQTLETLRSKLADLKMRIRDSGLDMLGVLEFQIAIIQKSIENLKAGKG